MNYLFRWYFLHHYIVLKQIKLDALKERAGREIRVFETYVSSSSNAALSNGNCTLSYWQYPKALEMLSCKFLFIDIVGFILKYPD